MFASENVRTVSLMIEVDPAGTDQFHLMKAPEALTVDAAYMVSENNLGAGTAGLLSLQNWGAAGTAVEGTICAALGTGLSANVPTAATVTSAQAYVDEGDWLVLAYTEAGGGWQSGDRLFYQVNYRIGK